jgi:hypothetical protein
MLTLLSTLKAKQLKLDMPLLLQSLFVITKARRLRYIFSIIKAANQRLNKRVQG